MAETNIEAWLRIFKTLLSMCHIMIECSQTFCHQSSKVRLLKVSIIKIHLTHGFRCYSLLLLYYLVKVARFELVARHANARHGQSHSNFELSKVSPWKISHIKPFESFKFRMPLNATYMPSYANIGLPSLWLTASPVRIHRNRLAALHSVDYECLMIIWTAFNPLHWSFEEISGRNMGRL